MPSDNFFDAAFFLNVMVGIITCTGLIIGFWLKDIHSDFKELKKEISKHDTSITLLVANDLRNQEDINDLKGVQNDFFERLRRVEEKASINEAKCESIEKAGCDFFRRKQNGNV